MPLQYEDALAFLQKCNTKDGSSVYEHLTRVVSKLLEEQPDTDVDLLEASLLAKITDFTAHTKESSPLVPISTAADAARATASAKLFGCPDLPIDPLTGEPVAADTPNDYECQDISADALLFESLGIGIGVTEMYAVMLAAKQLGDDRQRGVASVRFFGKFFGLYANYFVFETLLKRPAEAPAAPEGATPYEANTGANKFTYFVCSFPGGEFTQLPFLKPEHVKVARQIKKFLTGKLDAEVSTYPEFPGNEANYLRAQIARIAATTVLAPAGALQPNEDTNELEPTEDWEGVPGREAASMSAWVHRMPHLKKQGRCEVYKREPPEGEEDNPEWEPTEEELEEEVELLGGVDADNALGGVPPDEENAPPSWSPLYSSAQEHVKYQSGGLRSNLWQGAYAAAKGTQHACIYVGWGTKNAPFVPLPPPPVANEYDLAFVETSELPPKPVPPPPEGEEGDE